MQIFRIMGKPTEQTWEGITKCEAFNKVQWPDVEPLDLRQYIPKE